MVDGHAQADTDEDGLSYSDLVAFLKTEFGGTNEYEGFIRDVDPFEGDTGETIVRPYLFAASSNDYVGTLGVEVPEPASMMLLSLGVLCGLRRARKVAL